MIWKTLFKLLYPGYPYTPWQYEKMHWLRYGIMMRIYNKAYPRKCSNCKKHPPRKGQRYCQKCHADYQRYHRSYKKIHGMVQKIKERQAA